MLECNDWKKSNNFNLRKGRFGLDSRKKLVIMMVVRHWNRLLREVKDHSPLGVIKVKSDVILSNLVEWKVSLALAEGVEQDPSNSSHFMILLFTEEHG